MSDGQRIDQLYEEIRDYLESEACAGLDGSPGSERAQECLRSLLKIRADHFTDKWIIEALRRKDDA